MCIRDRIQCGLKKYGYGIEVTEEMDEQTFYVIRAFQYHFTPKNSNGKITTEMVSALWALIENYFPDSIKDDRLIDCKNN